MTLSRAYEDELEIIDEDDRYFIGQTDQWSDRPDGQLVLGYKAEHTKQIIPIDFFDKLGDPEEYIERTSVECRKHICIASGALRSRQEDLYTLDFCSGCHERARDKWRELMEENPKITMSQYL